MITIPRLTSSALLPLLLTLGSPLSAQWTGLGTGVGTGANINDPANWTDGNIDGSFATINAASTTTALTLSGDISVSTLNFAWTTANVGLSIGGTGVIAISGNVQLARGQQGTTYRTVIGSGVTLDLGSITTTRVFNDNNTGLSRTVIDGLITGTASGSGRIQFGGTNANTAITLNNHGNTFTSEIFVNSGVLNFTSVSAVGGGASALGSATDAANGRIVLGRNSSLRYIGATDQTTDRQIAFSGLSAGPVSISHGGAGGVLTYQSDLNFGSYAGQIRVGASSADAKLVFSGLISGSGDSRLMASYAGALGTTTLENVGNTYAGRTEIISGVLEVTKLSDGGVASSVGTSSNAAGNLVLGDYGDRLATLRYIGAGDSTDRLFTLGRNVGSVIESSGTGALKFTNTGVIGLGTSNQTEGRHLYLGGTNTDDNTLASSVGEISATYRTSLTKSDSGKWILTGTNTYTGFTTVTDGTLIVDGTLTSTVRVNVGVFGGQGSTTGDVTIGNSSGVRDSVFAVGSDVGGFSADGSLAFNSDAEFSYTFNSSLGVAEAVTASAVGISVHSSAFFTFSDSGNGSGVSVGESFMILANTGTESISGTFTNLAEGSTFTAGNITWQVSYVGGTGNDLTLTALEVGTIPEPASAAVLLGLATLGLVSGLRSRRARL